MLGQISFEEILLALDEPRSEAATWRRAAPARGTDYGNGLGDGPLDSPHLSLAGDLPRPFPPHGCARNGGGEIDFVICWFVEKEMGKPRLNFLSRNARSPRPPSATLSRRAERRR